jgi:L-lactate dehydrogenase complex protein LldE
MLADVTSISDSRCWNGSESLAAIIMKITLFIPCYVDSFYPQVGISMVRILERLGHRVEFPEELTCCGQPGFNSGCWAEARLVAEKVLRRLHDSEVVVIASGSCGAMVKNYYPELFAHSTLEKDAREFLVDRLGVTDVGARFNARVTYHDGCHSLREMNIREAPRRLLSHVKGLELIEMKQVVCCGFGGTFSAKFPMISTAMGEVKCAAAAETQADYIVSSDSSCLMHIQGLLDRQGKSMRTIHLAELLARS